MNEKTVFIYENVIGKLTFELESSYWITEIDNVSSVEIAVAASQSTMQIGSSISAQSVQPRVIPVDGAVFEPIRVTRERVIDIMAPQVPSTLTVEQNGESWFLDVVPTKTPNFIPGNGVQFFQAELYAAYPYWRTTESYAVQIAGLVALFKFPFFTGGKWWISQYSDTFFKEIENKGNVPMDFIVVFTARSAVTNPEIYHVGTRQLIRIRKEMIAGERIIVSTVHGQKGATFISATGEVSNGFRYIAIGSDLSMALQTGINLLRIDAASNREGLSVRIEVPEGEKSGL